jgi:hypothetical protein
MHTLLVSVLVVLLVGMWWVFVLWLLSELSGWRKLAAIFRAQHPPSGRCLPMQGGWVGDTLYTGCLTIYTSDEGLYVSIWPIFRFRQPPLLIPWSAIHNRREKRWMLSRLVQFDVGAPPISTMRLMPTVFRDAPDV